MCGIFGPINCYSHVFRWHLCGKENHTYENSFSFQKNEFGDLGNSSFAAQN